MAGVDAVRLAALAIGVVGLLATAAALVRSRGERPLAPFSIVVGAAGLAASAALTVLLPPIVFKEPVLWGLVGGGALVGAVLGRRVRVRRAPAGVMVRGGAWHLLPASIALVGLQLAGLAESMDGVVAATAAIVACAAFAVAAGAVLLARGWITRMRSPVVVDAAGSPAAGGASVAPVPPAVPPTTAASSRATRVVMSCAACGSPVSVGWRHCVSCGAALVWG